MGNGMARTREHWVFMGATVFLVFAQVGWAQTGFQGFRGRTYSGGLSIPGSVGSSFSGSSVSNFVSGSYQLRSSAGLSNDFSIPNLGSYSSAGRPSYGGMPKFGMTPRPNVSLTPNGMSSIGMDAGAGAFGVGLGVGLGVGRLPSLPQGGETMDVGIPLLGFDNASLTPEKPDDCAEFQAQCALSGQEALKPVMERQLQRPRMTGIAIKPGLENDTQSPLMDMDFSSQPSSQTTPQGSLYVAQQISRARDMIREKKYDLAINYYQAAQAIDSRNASALIGTTLCHIMTGKFQAGGLGVVRLAEEVPDFWMQPPNFTAVFGVAGTDLTRQFEDLEPQIDKQLRIYRPEDGKQIAEELKFVYLSRMFVAWVKQDFEGMKVNIQAAAQAVPLDIPVQQLCHRMTGTGEKDAIKFKPLKPIL
jgi:hypothetical protein